MDIPGLVNRISNAVMQIDSGRKGFATRGKEHEGRLSYEDGVSEAMLVFHMAFQKTHTILLVSLTEQDFKTYFAHPV